MIDWRAAFVHVAHATRGPAQEWQQAQQQHAETHADEKQWRELVHADLRGDEVETPYRADRREQQEVGGLHARACPWRDYRDAF